MAGGHEHTLTRQFQVTQPNRVWAGEITYIGTVEGCLYLAVMLDLYSRTVIGLAMMQLLTVGLAERALIMALMHPKPTAGFLHHSDRSTSLSVDAQPARHYQQHEPHRELLRQRLCRKLFRATQARDREPLARRDP